MTQDEIVAAIVFGVVGGVLANDVGDWSSWLARKMMRQAAYLWTPDATLAEVYAEKWQRSSTSGPGSLLKLLTGLGYLGVSLARYGSRKARQAAANRKHRKMSSRESSTVWSWVAVFVRSVMVSILVRLVGGPAPWGSWLKWV